MSELDDRVVFFEDLTPEQSEALRAAMQADPGLRTRFAHWQQIRSEIRERLNRDVPDRSVLVLYALRQNGRTDLLSPEEHRTLEAALPSLEAAFEAHPALEDVVHRTGKDCHLFERLWADHFGHGPDNLDAPMEESRPAVRHARRRPIWRVAVGFAVVALAAILIIFQMRDRNMIAVETGSGESQVITLADGSTIRLQENSKLSYPDPQKGGTSRLVRLNGAAFFDVKPGAQPFSVETRQAVATVLGTRFGVLVDNKATQVILATGKLSLAPADDRQQMVVLQPGDMSRVEGDQAPTKPVQVNVARSLTWTGMYVFDNTSLLEITRILSEDYQISVRPHYSLAKEIVHGEFEKGRPVQEILDTIAASLDARVQETGRSVYQIVPAAQ